MECKRQIRQAVKSDIPQIREIISSAICQCVTDEREHQEFLCDDVCKSVDKWLADKDDSLLLVCQQDESLLGMAQVKEFWNVSALFVDPRYHCSGIGRELVARIIEDCRHRSPRGGLKLNSSTCAAGFYKKMGFIQTGDALDRPGGCIPFEYRFE